MEAVNWKYEMNPETEIAVRGHNLKNGMVVLIEPRILRSSEGDLRYKEANRWCTVTNLGNEYAGDGTNLVTFIGVYEDGYQTQRSYNESWTWLVKKDSLDVENERRLKVFGYVDEALQAQCSIITNTVDDPYVDDIRQALVDKIMKLF